MPSSADTRPPDRAHIGEEGESGKARVERGGESAKSRLSPFLSIDSGTVDADFLLRFMALTLLPPAVIAMLAYMFWRTAVQMRRDRVLREREATRGKNAFTPLHRARYVLRKAFQPRADEPQWLGSALRPDQGVRSGRS